MGVETDTVVGSPPEGTTPPSETAVDIENDPRFAPDMEAFQRGAWDVPSPEAEAITAPVAEPPPADPPAEPAAAEEPSLEDVLEPAATEESPPVADVPVIPANSPDIPEKFWGKPWTELAKSYTGLEKLQGRMANDLAARESEIARLRGSEGTPPAAAPTTPAPTAPAPAETWTEPTGEQLNQMVVDRAMREYYRSRPRSLYGELTPDVVQRGTDAYVEEAEEVWRIAFEDAEATVKEQLDVRRRSAMLDQELRTIRAREAEREKQVMTRRVRDEIAESVKKVVSASKVQITNLDTFIGNTVEQFPADSWVEVPEEVRTSVITMAAKAAAYDEAQERLRAKLAQKAVGGNTTPEPQPRDVAGKFAETDQYAHDPRLKDIENDLRKTLRFGAIDEAWVKAAAREELALRDREKGRR